MDAILVVFGGTGDLTLKKLVPALYELKCRKALPESFIMVGIGRKTLTDETYRSYLLEALEKNNSKQIDYKIWDAFKECVHYLEFSFEDDNGYLKLDELLNEHNAYGRRNYYLAVAPKYFSHIAQRLLKHNMHRGEQDGEVFSHKVVIEKPFGEDLETATALNKSISSVFGENDIFRIDHYLGKEMIQNILSLRFGNLIFEPLWNAKYVDHVQITSFEKFGIENRGEYYDRAGILLDMVQNHMLQLLTLTAMEPPVSLDAGDIRDEKVKVLRSMADMTDKEILKNTVRGQYTSNTIDDVELKAYREEANVNSESMRETFVALRLFIENPRWLGVPFYIRTGKRMSSAYTQITIVFKRLPELLYGKTDLTPNKLIIRVQPNEGISLGFHAKAIGMSRDLVPVSMDYVHNCLAGGNTPQAYERLLMDIFAGDNTLFTRWDELHYAWKLTDKISKAWKTKPTISMYKACDGSGPIESEELIEENGRHWIDETGL